MLRATILLLACVPCAAQNVGRITGTVTDAATHQPVPKAHVGSVTGDPSSNTFVGALTGPDGVYTLENVPAGAIRITVNLDGYKFIPDPPGRQPGFPLAAGETLHRDYALHPQGRIYGRLIDRDSGKPITGHAVLALQMETRPGQTFYIEHAGEQKGSEFEISKLDPGVYYLQIEAGDEPTIVVPADAGPKPAPGKVYGKSWYPDASRLDLAVPVRLGEGESRAVDIALRARDTHSLSGVVEAPRELATQPLTLTLQRSGLAGTVAGMPAPGSFRIDNLSPGGYRLALLGGKPPADIQKFRDYILFMADSPTAAKPAVNAVGDAVFDISDHDIENFKIALTPYASVAGEVRMLEPDAVPPSKFGIVLAPVSETSGPTNTDPPPPNVVMIRVSPVTSGKFRQEWLHPGEYWPQFNNLPAGYAVAQILLGGGLPSDGTVSLSGPDTPLTIVLTSHPGAIAGVVRDSDQNPVSQATVVLFPDGLTAKTDRSRILTKSSGADGSFAFRDLAPGKYRAITLSEPDGERQGDVNYLREKAAGMDAIEVTGGQTVRVEVKR